MTTLTTALEELRSAVDEDDPIALSDDQLAELAELAARELVSRLPRYAMEQGDIEGDGVEEDVEAREELLSAVVRFRGEST